MTFGKLIMKVSKKMLETTQRHWRVWNCEVSCVDYAIRFEDVIGPKTVIRPYTTLQLSVAFYTMNQCEKDLTPRNKEVKLEDEVEEGDGDSNDGPDVDHDDLYFMSIISKTHNVLVMLMMS
nr:hypothetical protein [Tanacetum cinerariifolium]